MMLTVYGLTDIGFLVQGVDIGVGEQQEERTEHQHRTPDTQQHIDGIVHVGDNEVHIEFHETETQQCRRKKADKTFAHLHEFHPDISVREIVGHNPSATEYQCKQIILLEGYLRRKRKPHQNDKETEDKQTYIDQNIRPIRLV